MSVLHRLAELGALSPESLATEIARTRRPGECLSCHPIVKALRQEPAPYNGTAASQRDWVTRYFGPAPPLQTACTTPAS